MVGMSRLRVMLIRAMAEPDAWVVGWLATQSCWVVMGTTMGMPLGVIATSTMKVTKSAAMSTAPNPHPDRPDRTRENELSMA
jgi:hypothetical protein